MSWAVGSSWVTADAGATPDSSARVRPIRVGLLGLGVVGGGVARLLSQKAAAIAAEIGRPVVVHRALARVPPERVYREGIRRLRAADFRYARELGYVIKLLAIGKKHPSADRPDGPHGRGGQIEVRVHPTLLPQDFLLADVNGVFNAVHVQGDLVGNVLFYGRGAGAAPTSSAVVADVVDVAHNLNAGVANRIPFHYAGELPVRPMSDLQTRYYVRLWVADQPGVLAQIARVFGDHRISIASCIQKESDPAAGAAELVIVTHPAQEAGLQAALAEIAALPVIRELANTIRI